MPRSIFDWAPVRDCLGRTIRFVHVMRDEKTCLDCGETVPATLDYCMRCSDTQEGIYMRDLVLTVSYLRDGEYVLVD